MKKMKNLNLCNEEDGYSVVERARSSKDRTPVRLTGISHEFFSDNGNCRNQHTLRINEDSNYKNFSVQQTGQMWLAASGCST